MRRSQVAAAAVAAVALATATPWSAQASSAPTFLADVRAYGAKGDGKTLVTSAIVAAIADISSHGGGTLYFPPGTWLSAPFNLTSHLTLLLDNAYLLATPNMSAWDLIAPLPSYGQGRDHSPVVWERYTSFIHGFNLTDVTITTNSTGLIHGNGYPWWQAHGDGSLCCTPGHLIEFLYSRDIVIGAPLGSPPNSLILKDSPFWNIHIYDSDDAWIHDVTILADPLYENTDGVDPDSARNVLIERVIYVGGDDGVAIKSGWDEAGIAYNKPTVNVTIRDCSFTTRSSCVCIGSEMSGGVENVTVTGVNCTGTATGYYVKSAPGRGGYVANFTMTDSTFTGVAEGIVLSMAYGDHPDGKPVNTSALPTLSGFTVTRISGSGVGTAGSLQGMPGAVFTGVSITDVNLGPSPYPGTPAWKCTNVTGTAVDVFPSPAGVCPGLSLE